MRPQAPDRPGADRLEELQSWGAVQEPGFLAAIGDGFGEQVDEPVVRSVDAAGNVRLPENGGPNFRLQAG